MKFEDEPETPITVNIVPMIDVVFAILTFLIVSSLDLQRIQTFPLESSLPQNQTVSPKISIQPVELTVMIRSNGAIFLNRQPFTLTQLKQKIQQTRQTSPQTTSLSIFLQADPTLPYGQVIEVMNTLNEITGVKIILSSF